MKDLGARVLASLCFRRELEQRTNFSEGGRRPYHWYERGLLVKILAEADDDDVDEL